MTEIQNVAVILSVFSMIGAALVFRIFREIERLKIKNQRTVTRKQIYNLTKFLNWHFTLVAREIQSLKESQINDFKNERN
jgi:hypothetical protein